MLSKGAMEEIRMVLNCFTSHNTFSCSANCEAALFCTSQVPNYKLVCKYFSYRYGRFVRNRKFGITTISPFLGLVTFLPSLPFNCGLFNNPSMLIIISYWHFHTFSGSLNLFINRKGTALIRKNQKGACPRLSFQLEASSLSLVCLSYFFLT